MGENENIIESDAKKDENDRKSVRIRENKDDNNNILIELEPKNTDTIRLREPKLSFQKTEKKLFFRPQKVFQDTNDVISNDPSYSSFEIPYEVKCKIRYSETFKKYDNQFLRDNQKLELFQQNAYAAARCAKHMGITTLWPPLHNRREVNRFINKFFVHTPKDQKRLRFLLTQTQT